MRGPWLLCVIVLGCTRPQADAEGFDDVKVGELPAGWACGVTGGGSPRWAVERDSTAPTPPSTLKQAGQGDFPWCVKKTAALADGFVEVKLKAISGQEDQAGGVVWRWTDANNYYIARVNALEDNVALFYIRDGRRRSLKSTSIHVSPREWHTLRVEFSGPRFTVLFDGKRVIDLEETSLQGAGSVGVWTKADSVTAFDAFRFGGK